MILFHAKKYEITPNHTIVADKILDVPYGLHIEQTMDIYLPADRSASYTKSMIIIHGGGFNGGNKADLDSYLEPMRLRLLDYAFFNINYRLAVDNSTLFPTQENDVRAALEHIVGNAETYSFQKKWLCLVSVQAGSLHYCRDINIPIR